jgi:hypothetical protein
VANHCLPCCMTAVCAAGNSTSCSSTAFATSMPRGSRSSTQHCRQYSGSRRYSASQHSDCWCAAPAADHMFGWTVGGCLPAGRSALLSCQLHSSKQDPASMCADWERGSRHAPHLSYVATTTTNVTVLDIMTPGSEHSPGQSTYLTKSTLVTWLLLLVCLTGHTGAARTVSRHNSKCSTPSSHHQALPAAHTQVTRSQATKDLACPDHQQQRQHAPTAAASASRDALSSWKLAASLPAHRAAFHSSRGLHVVPWDLPQCCGMCRCSRQQQW